jgi:hypothetical protein
VTLTWLEVIVNALTCVGHVQLDLVRVISTQYGVRDQKFVVASTRRVAVQESHFDQLHARQLHMLVDITHLRVQGLLTGQKFQDFNPREETQPALSRAYKHQKRSTTASTHVILRNVSSSLILNLRTLNGSPPVLRASLHSEPFQFCNMVRSFCNNI